MSPTSDPPVVRPLFRLNPARLHDRVRGVRGRPGRVAPPSMAATARYGLPATVPSALRHHVERHGAEGAVR
ncbi:hypothetical protein ABZ172_10360 [Streptomyces sp. NPDC006296]|uniref:hypothetical protein n=1 Tax=Streptomyces sp. NPDC006296 TaxID=3156746 RepID=UPI0033B5137F